jgi:hypothetical protein
MRENRPPGSVRGPLSDWSYRDGISETKRMWRCLGALSNQGA